MATRNLPSPDVYAFREMRRHDTYPRFPTGWIKYRVATSLRRRGILVTRQRNIREEGQVDDGPRPHASSVSAFNIRHNWNHLMRRPAFHEPVVDGVRALAVLWVMVSHMLWYQYPLFPTQTTKIATTPAMVWVLNGHQGVDLFFVISGFLMGSILFAEMKKTGGLVFSRFYVRRFLRLIPVYAAAMVLGLYLLHHLHAKNFWANLIYVNNFLPVSKQYMTWCWSLAIEEQFYLVLPACILLFMGPGKGRLRILVLLTGLSVSIRFAVIHFSGIVPPYRFAPDSPAYQAYYNTIYDKPWMRFGGLLAGVSGAYLNSYFPGQLKRFFARTGAVTAISLLCLAGIAYIASTFGGSVFFDRIPYLARELWWAFHRDVLSLSVIFLILAAIHTPRLFGGWLRRFLSWKVFYPIAQLSYSFYLVHEMLFQWLFPKIAPAFRQHLSPYETLAVDSAVGFAIAAMIAVTFYVTIERPCMRLRSSPTVLRFIASIQRLSGRNPAKQRPCKAEQAT
jgi:peptidoglycan/LPS O-acetylase OafA/YrhL